MRMLEYEYFINFVNSPTDFSRDWAHLSTELVHLACFNIFEVILIVYTGHLNVMSIPHQQYPFDFIAKLIQHHQRCYYFEEVVADLMSFFL